MKQFTIFNQLTAMPKRLAMVLTVLFTLGVGTMLGAEKTDTIRWGTYTTSGTSATLTITWTANTSCTITQAKGDNTSNNVSTSYATSPRWYQHHHITFTPKTGCTIKKVVLTGSSSSYHGQDMTFVEGSGTISKSGNATTITGAWTSSFKIKMGKQFRPGSVVVTYEEAATCTTNPTVSAGSHSNVTTTTATASCSGGITSLGSAGCSITSYGFVYGTSSNPTISNTKVQVGTSYTTTGTSFSKSITGLSANTTYYVRPYATNGYGTAYGTQTTFKTSELSKYTVSFSTGTGNPTQESIKETVGGAGITLPTGPTPACDGWEFAGWKETSAVSTETTTAPTLLPEGSNYKPTGNCTLYAVYSRTVGGGGNTTGSKTFTLSTIASANSWENGVAYTSIKDYPVTIVAEGGGNNGKWYTSSNGSWRMYSGGTVRIAADGGIITSVTSTPSCTFTINNGEATFSPSARTDFTKFVVEYSVAGGSTTYYHSTPQCAGPCASLAAPSVTATNITSNSFTLSWNAVDGATSYNVYNYTTEDMYETTSTSYTFSGLDANTTYEWVIEAAKDTCYKSTNGTTTTSVALTPLATPTNLKVTNISCSGATLTWDNVANNNGYLLSVKNTSSSTTFNSNIAKDVTSGTPTLNPGTTYTWNVIAKGDDANYTNSEVADGGSFTTNYKITYNVKGGTWTACADGCVAGGEDFTICSTVPTKTGYNFMGWSTADDTEAEYQAGETIENVSANITLYAVWEQKTYTVILSENGTTTTPTTQTSTSYTLPTELSAGTCQDDTKEFVGWTTISNLNSAEEPTTDYYAKGEIVTLSADETTFYAVFATPGSGGGGAPVETTTTLDFSAQGYENGELVTSLTQGDVTITLDKGSNSNDTKYYTTGTAVRVYGGGYFTVSVPSGSTISSITLTFGSGDGSNGITVITGSYTSGTTSGTWTGSASSVKFSVGGSSGHRRIKTVRVTFATTTQGGTSYSDYTTSCVALPDPVISFVTTPADPIVFDPVNCGSTTTKAQAKTVQVSGANLQEYVSVEVTGPYKIARTSSTNLSDYTTSLTLDKTNTGNINANYSTIYIISCPPAQSTDATTGTLTFTTKKGNTLTVNLSTPTVNCTQYTLTLNDRGTKTTAEYYAGASVLEPEDPTGVCTDPIHYVFDGWAEATVANGSTEYTKVTFPYSMPGQNKTLHAVYRYVEEGSGDSGDYVKVTEDLDDYSGDYLIVYETGSVAFDGGLDELDVTSNTINVTISSNTIASNATTDAAKFTIAKVDGGYSIKSTSGYYIGWSTADKNGLNANSKYSANYYLNTISNSIISGVKGTLKYNKTSGQERFRYYQSGQESIALYRKAASYLYTTSPVCGPHLEITAGKEIYVTGGNAQAARDLVMAQQKVSYKATRLKTQDGSPEGTAPDVKVATNGITKGGVVTTEVKVTFENTVKEQQPDDTYTITGDIVVTYEAGANNLKEDIQVQLAVDYPANADARDNFTVHARSLPSEFVIVAKSGDKWYALNADMSSSKAQPANGQVTLNDLNNPTEAIYAPCNAIYTFEAMPQGAADRISVRFIGMENKYLWSASEGNTGIQNNSKNPTADALAYNWKLYTEDNITYHFGNAQNTRMLGLHSTNVAFGMYANGASVVQDIRILPYVEKCLYNYAPTNLKVSVLKGTYVTLTWDAVAGATKYQYSTDATNWTDCGTEPTVTINGLTEGRDYTYYIRAYHEDDATKECIDYSEISFTTANCDDVPADITYSADLTSITVTWTAVSTNCTVRLYSDEACTSVVKFADELKGSVTFSQLDRNTTYYVRVFAEGTCASPIIPVKTEDVEVDIVEWMPDNIIVDINTNETVSVSLENEVAFGTGVGKKAEDIFFSKYFEANGTAKILAIYNGTDEKIDLSTVSILNDLSSQSLDLAEFGHKEVGYIYPNEEIILFNKGVEAVTECSEQQDSYSDWYNVEHGVLNFGGRATLILKRGDAVIDIIGSIETQGTNYPNDLVGTTIYNIAKSPTGENEKPSWGDDPGWVCESGDNIMTDVEETDYPLSTNRCLLVRKNTVISGVNAVTNNVNKVFATLCDEWVGLQIPQNAPSTDKGVTESCEGMAFVGDFDYSSYYTKYESMGNEQVFDENARNADGTVTIPITNLYKQSCRNIRIKLSNSNGDVLTDREYKVPIMITTNQGTDGEAFIALQENLATVEIDGNGNPTGNKNNLTLEQVREICKTCDVVVRDNATLTKVTDGTTNDHPQVRNVYVYEGASIVIPNGNNHNYTINGLSLRRKGDVVASAQVQGTGKFVLPADEPVCLDLRVDANNWHWFTLPYDCLIEDVTWVDGTPAKYNTDWFLMYYDGESRAASTNPYDNHWKVYNGTTIEAGKGYIVGITGDLTHPNYTFELRFPMAQEVLTDEQTNKTVPVNAWGVQLDNTPNNKGWNLVGNPYLNYYKTADEYSLAGLPLIKYTSSDLVVGEFYEEENGNIPFLVTPIDGGWYEYRQELASEVNMMPFTAYFVQVGDPNTHENGQELEASFEASNRGEKSIVRRAPREVEEIEEPIIVRVELTNSKGESDKTSLVIDQRFTNEYEMNGDFFKWFGDYYNYYTKPVLYTIGADQGKRAFNALNEELAKQPIPVGMYAAQAGNYTFSLNQQFDLSRVEEVWLYDATQSTYTNLMQSDYTFSTSKVNGAGRFSLSVKLAPKVATGMENVNADKVWATTQNQQIIVNGLENNTQLWMYDAAGKLLYTEVTSNYQHRYSVPQVGTYFIALQKGTTKQTIKVVVE